MASLILKDLLLNKKTFGISLLYSLFAIFVFRNMPGGAFVVSAIGIGYLFMIRAVTADDKNQFERILCSLPIKRSRIVLAKYFSMLVYAGIGILSYLLVSSILRLLKPGMNINPITGAEILLMLFTLFLMASIYLPLYFKWGYMKTQVIHTLMFLFLFFMPSFVSGFLYSEQKNPILKALIQPVHNFFTNLSPLGASLFTLGLTVILTGISIRLSIGIYTKQEF